MLIVCKFMKAVAEVESIKIYITEISYLKFQINLLGDIQNKGS